MFRAAWPLKQSEKKYKVIWSLDIKPLLCFNLDNTSNNETNMVSQILGWMLKHTLFLRLACFYLLNHCAMISSAKVETPHIKLYSEHRLHPPCVLWKNPIIGLKVRETLQRSNQRHTLYSASVQCMLELGSSAAIFRSQFKNYYHLRSVVHFL